jgi:hypothetical protein
MNNKTYVLVRIKRELHVQVWQLILFLHVSFLYAAQQTGSHVLELLPEERKVFYLRTMELLRLYDTSSK